MNEIKKFCADCKTRKTPLWRSGPAGPKSLCNACGIRHRKKRSAIVGLNKRLKKKKEKSGTRSRATTTTTTPTTCSTTTAPKNPIGGGNGADLCVDLRVQLVTLGKEAIMLKRQKSPRQKKLGEEEQAALSLMALSRGSVYV